jgi:YVTN family beta-propeller protein
MTSIVRAVAFVVTVLAALPAVAASPFTTFESGQVRPLAMSPDGARLFAVNTPDNRLEIFDIGIGTLTKVASVPVGLEPVAVAARTNGEVWVVNHLSDSVSVVDVSTLATARVVRTLLVGDEPRDIVFAGPGGARAFVTTAHRGQNTPFHATIETTLTTEGLGRADVWVFDATDLGTTLAGTPETVVTLFGDTPRALTVSPDGSTVYAAVFHSGNRTTTVGEGLVPNGGEGSGGLPEPNANHALVPGPEVGLIVKFDGANWLDELGRSWNTAIRFALPDQDVFKIDANANPPIQVAGPSGFFTGVGTILFNMVTNPVSGKVYVANLESFNEVRFEGPGTFAAGFKPPGEPATVRGHLAESRVTVLDGASVLPRHLNKHIDYSTCCAPIPNTENDDSLGFPVGMAVSSDGATLYVAGFGSSEVGVYDTTQLEADTFTPSAANQIGVTGGGPTGLVLDEVRSQLYVLTRFDDSISVVSTGTGSELAHVALHNPEPDSVKIGRPFLYDTSLTSSHGDSSCASCHIFGDFDSLAWDLGDPDGDVLNNPGPFTIVLGDPDLHPMKGPMTTQSLRGMANHGPMHWRGDRTGGNDAVSAQPNGGAFDEVDAFGRFNPAFEGLIGRSAELTPSEMQAFTDFILQVMYPPNPIRNIDNSLTANQLAAQTKFFGPISDTIANCDGCHTTNRNGNKLAGEPIPGFFGGDGRSSFEAETQHFKVPHLRNMYQKVGMFGLPAVAGINNGNNGFLGDQIRGFGFLHDGSIDTLFRFHNGVVFNQSGGNPGGFPAGPAGDTERFQMEVFMMAFDTNLFPVVGQQATLGSTSGADVTARIDLMLAQANLNTCDVVVKGIVGGRQAGFHYLGGNNFETDRDGESSVNKTALLALANTPGQELTFTAVPGGSGQRIGVDQDGDGVRDQTEREGNADPADPNSTPNACPNDPTCAKCERAITKEGAKYSQARSKALASCELSKLKGSLPPVTDCAVEAGGKLSKAATKLASGIAKACGGTDKTCGGVLTGETTPTALGWPATCPDFEGTGCMGAVTSCADITSCLQCIGDAAIDQAMDLYFDDLAASPVGSDVNKCQQTIGKEAQKFLATKAKEIAKCWDGRIKGKHGAACPDAAGVEGSPARKAADKIAQAEGKARAKICKACGGPDALCDGNGDLTTAAIGAPATCPAVTIPGGASCGGAIATLDNLVDCTFCVTEFKVDCVDRAQVPGFATYPAECNP